MEMQFEHWQINALALKRETSVFARCISGINGRDMSRWAAGSHSSLTNRGQEDLQIYNESTHPIDSCSISVILQSWLMEKGQSQPTST